MMLEKGGHEHRQVTVWTVVRKGVSSANDDDSRSSSERRLNSKLRLKEGNYTEKQMAAVREKLPE
jgi:hypothetical protein